MKKFPNLSRPGKEGIDQSQILPTLDLPDDGDKLSQVYCDFPEVTVYVDQDFLDADWGQSEGTRQKTDIPY